MYDTYYSEKFGKRKSYIVPIYLINGICFLVASFYINDWVKLNNIAYIFGIGFLIETLTSFSDLAT